MAIIQTEIKPESEMETRIVKTYYTLWLFLLAYGLIEIYLMTIVLRWWFLLIMWLLGAAYRLLRIWFPRRKPTFWD